MSTETKPKPNATTATPTEAGAGASTSTAAGVKPKARKRGSGSKRKTKGGRAKAAPKTKGKAKAAGTGSRPKGKTGGAARLRPGGLDSIVLADLRKREGEWPLTASSVGKSVGRSGGAVANCLARLERDKKARLAKRKPRSYDLKGV